MIRNLVSFRSVNLIRRSFVTSSIGPNTNTCLLLKGLSASTTEDSLRSALTGLPNPPRIVEIEPGCSLQFLNQCEADVSASAIKSTLGFKVRNRCFTYCFSRYCQTEVANATIPSLSLQNIPMNTTSESLTQAFRAHKPRRVHILGGLSVEFVVVDAASALRVSKALEAITMENQKLMVTCV